MLALGLEDVDLLGLRVSLGPQPLSPDSPSQRGEGSSPLTGRGSPVPFGVLASSVPILCPTCSQPQLQSATSWLQLICPHLPILLYFLSPSSGKSWVFCLFVFYDLFFDHVMLGMWDLSSLRRD